MTDNDLDDFYASDDDDQTAVPISAKTKKMKKKKVNVRDFIDDEAEECTDSEEESVKKVKKGNHSLHKRSQPLISTSSEDNSSGASDNEDIPPAREKGVKTTPAPTPSKKKKAVKKIKSKELISDSDTEVSEAGPSPVAGPSTTTTTRRSPRQKTATPGVSTSKSPKHQKTTTKRARSPAPQPSPLTQASKKGRTDDKKSSSTGETDEVNYTDIDFDSEIANLDEFIHEHCWCKFCHGCGVYINGQYNQVCPNINLVICPKIKHQFSISASILRPKTGNKRHIEIIDLTSDDNDVETGMEMEEYNDNNILDEVELTDDQVENAWQATISKRGLHEIFDNDKDKTADNDSINEIPSASETNDDNLDNTGDDDGIGSDDNDTTIPFLTRSRRMSKNGMGWLSAKTTRHSITTQTWHEYDKARCDTVEATSKGNSVSCQATVTRPTIDQNIKMKILENNHPTHVIQICKYGKVVISESGKLSYVSYNFVPLDVQKCLYCRSEWNMCHEYACVNRDTDSDMQS